MGDASDGEEGGEGEEVRVVGSEESVVDTSVDNQGTGGGEECGEMEEEEEEEE